MNPADNQNNPPVANTPNEPVVGSPPDIGNPPQDSPQPMPSFIPSNDDQAPTPPPVEMPVESQATTQEPATQSEVQPQAPTTPEVVTTSGNSNTGSGNRKKIIAAVVIVIMLFGIGAGVYAFRNFQAGSTVAWECSLYRFNIDENGTVTVQNGSSVSESNQQAQVYINGTLVETFEVPALASGQGTTLGTVSLPTNQSYTWRVSGTVDCENSGSRQVNSVTAECSEVMAYDESWTLLTPSDLSSLSEGDVVRFAVEGTAQTGVFDMARFSINGETPVEVTDKRPNSEMFYYEYTIPEDQETFNVSAEIHHAELGWF